MGDGKFKSNTLYSRFEAHPYTAEVWDVDKDGLFDIIFGVPSKGIYIAYGKLLKKIIQNFSKNFIIQVCKEIKKKTKIFSNLTVSIHLS